MNRRGFVLAAASGMAFPLEMLAQAATRTIGYLSPRSAAVEREFLAAIRQGLSDTTAGPRKRSGSRSRPPFFCRRAG